MIDMPGRTIDLLFRSLEENDGTLSNRARAKEFAALTEEEARQVEAHYRDVFSKAGP